MAVTIRRGDGFGDGETEYRQPCLIPGGARKVAGKQGASSPQQAEACFFKKKVNVFCLHGGYYIPKKGSLVNGGKVR